jgi:hypothetical protein
MIKTHKDSKIVQFHHNSPYGIELLRSDGNSREIILQIESLEHKKFDFIAEVINKNDYHKEA